jgi:hypothetical protein
MILFFILTLVPLQSFDFPIIHDVHDISTREIIGVGQEDCTQAGILQHFGPALIVPSISMHIISA